MTNEETFRILVVDDEPFMRRTVRAMLRRIGCPFVEEAHDGEAALASVAREKPDLVLCDIDMKPMGGLKFVRRLRNNADPALRDLPVIMLTSYADPGVVQAAAKLGISGYLVKPVSPKLLADRLDRMFKGKRLPPGATISPASTANFS